MLINLTFLFYISCQFVDAESIHLLLRRGALKQYVGQIGLGSSRQLFVVLIDTKSPLFWVPSALAPPNTWPGHSKYDPGASIYHVPSPRQFRIDYQTGYLAGLVALDQLTVTHRTVPFIRFGHATTVTTENTLVHQYEGVLGLAPKGGEAPFDETLLDQMETAESIKEKLFTLVFCPHPEANYKVGDLTFGEVIRDQHVGTIDYVQLFTEEAWSFVLTRVSVDDVIVKDLAAVVAIDSTKPHILGPSDVILAIHQRLSFLTEENGLYRVDCSRLNNLQDIVFHVGEKQLRLSVEDYVTQTMTQGVLHCYSALKHNPSSRRWIFGIPFLQGFFTVFDQDKKLLGFAKPKC
ncbi:Chymosin [Clonorchis sinensis]|uniref:Chymosin n=1 Tax=Clonorchis sinensis TaxID=79923 RepID=A0A8T1MRM0_CLOSI|nr:Chymosin [Clonorchis sinensis]